MIYEVHIGEQVFDAIRRAVRYIVVDCDSPVNAERWLGNLWDRIDELELMPRRFGVDEVYTSQVGCATHKLVFGAYLVYYQVDDGRGRVNVVDFVHGATRADVEGR
ncbi:MAG: type II toxin-antitoxin system RelE/ParE family toxin [Phycisphaerales bacterium JB063]